ncbi:MAG: AAA family ATPase [Anaerolineales bacterium]
MTKPNPFRPGNGISPPYLAGRDEQLKLFKKSLDTALTLPQNMVISGVRGTGKTALLKEFEKICQEKKWLCIRREFNPRHCSEAEFVGAVLTDVATKLKGALVAKGLTKRKIGFLPEEERAPITEEIIYNLLSKYPGPLGDRFESALKEVHHVLEETGFHGLVLLYDEFHYIEDQRIQKNYPLSMLLEAFSHCQQEGLRYYLVLSGLPPLFPNLVSAKTYAERMFIVEELGSLDKDAARSAVVKPFKDSPLKFEKQLVEELVSETKGYPYFLQFYSYYLIDTIPKSKITLSDFKKIYPMLLGRLDKSFFAGRFERASDSERELLFNMAQLGTEIKVAELRKRTKLSKNVLNQFILSLVEKGLIYRERRGAYAFALPLFNEFLLRVRGR